MTQDDKPTTPLKPDAAMRAREALTNLAGLMLNDDLVDALGQAPKTHHLRLAIEIQKLRSLSSLESWAIEIERNLRRLP